MVFTVSNLPRALLALTGGAVADRVGPWRVLLGGDGVMVLAMVGFAVAAGLFGATMWLLVFTALVIGLVEAFYQPASGSMPRRLAPAPALARAMSANQLALHVSRFLGAPLGGVVVVGVGLVGVAVINASTFALMLLVLVLLWRWCAAEETAADETRAGGLWRRSLDGVRVAARHELLRPALLQLALFAGLLLPVMTVLVPLLGHARAWSGDMTGVIVGADGLGIGVVAAAVITRGTLPRPGRVGVGGLFLAAVGMAGMAGSPTAGVAVAAGAVTGAGVGAFTTHVAPLILGNAPATHVSRVQALVTVV